MQIGLNELLIILFVIIIAYGFYKARAASPTRPTSDRADQQAANSQAGGANPHEGTRGLTIRESRRDPAALQPSKTHTSF